MKEMFDATARYCEDTYGAYIELDENGEIEYFLCPECGEPLYEEDWATEWDCCPICDFWFDANESV